MICIKTEELGRSKEVDNGVRVLALTKSLLWTRPVESLLSTFPCRGFHLEVQIHSTIARKRPEMDKKWPYSFVLRLSFYDK